MTYRLKNIKTGEIGRTIYWSLVMARAVAGPEHVIVDQYGNLVRKPIIRFRCFGAGVLRK